MSKFIIGGLAAFATVSAFVLGTGTANASCYENCSDGGTSNTYSCQSWCD
jgi:hypothetical protein